MSLSEHVTVNSLYTRSINLERDGEVTGIAYPYVPTTRAIQTVGRVVDSISDQVAPRAWALVGPYGAGKSAFGLFLAQLLTNRESAASRHARGTIRSAAPETSRALRRKLGKGRGFCVALLTGSPEPIARRVALALLRAAEAYWAGPGRMPSVIGTLRAASNQPDLTTTDLLRLLSDLQAAVGRAGGAGTALIVDEVGKFLEFEARHRQGGDIFLLQALAEHACAANKVPFQVVVLMHQGFEHYAKGFGGKLQDEWRKVQGRFENVPFVETTEQTLRVIRAALFQKFGTRERKLIHASAATIATTLHKQAALPRSLDAREACELFAACYPLHPVSILALPLLCNRVAQSERTLFGYLGSHEPYGFQERLGVKHVDGKSLAWIEPSEIYGYFIFTQPGLLTDHATHRRWAEVSTAIERLGDAPGEEVRLLKAIGLLNIIGAQAGLKAAPALLETLGERSAVQRALAALEDRSAITFRKFSREYRVWQGSDFDVDASAQQEREQLSKTNISEILNERQVIGPMVARRHSIDTGTLRFFAARFCEVPSADQARATSPTILYCLSNSRAEKAQIAGVLAALENPMILTAIVDNALQIADAVVGVMALERVRKTRAELQNDPVAQRELNDRLAAARRLEEDAIVSITEQPEDLEWYWCGKRIRIGNKRQLQERLSRLLGEIYHGSPHLQNELINRDRPSATAVAARNKLVALMLECPDKIDLGIERFPAEKSMYRALLAATGLHRKVDNAWQFVPPDSEGEARTRIGPLWNTVDKFLELTEQRPEAVSKLLDAFRGPPHGVKDGVVPVLLVSILQCFGDRLALYEEGQFIPFIGPETIERLMKNPEAFALQHFQIEGITKNLLRRYSSILTGQEPAKAVTLLAVAKPLARFMMTLPDYTKRTRRSLSEEAMSIRDLFFSAKSPAELLLHALPRACGVEPFLGGNEDTDKLERFAKKLSSAVVELRVCYHALLQDFQLMLKRAFSLDEQIDLLDLRDRVRGRYTGLEQFTIDTQGLRAFLGRLTDSAGDEVQWLVSVAAFLGRKPPEKWTDDDVQAVEYRLAEYSGRLRDLERLRLVQADQASFSSGDIEVILLKTIRRGQGERSLFVTIDSPKRNAIAGRVADVDEIIGELDPDLRAALLAELIERYGRREDQALDQAARSPGLG